ncbi:MAG: hypothetical protein DRJ01_14475 [Bacteroidetes bacterium]|nr:MAG: hypothetical protein DRJ01_14475 [Bacteroidota bacterium]
MSEKKILLEPDKFYHIFNRGINSMDIFFENDNYEHFLRLYDKYIGTIADTYAWVLMKNHFHLLVRIKSQEDIVASFPQLLLHLQGFKNLEDVKAEMKAKVKKRIYQQFSNLFNAYAKAINKRFGRTGALLESNFHRKPIEDIEYFKNVVIYIHNNPVHHKICKHPIEYPWSSYLSCMSLKSTKLKRDKVIGWFDNEANFKLLNNDKSFDFAKINDFLFKGKNI